jgi:hypothetical protein
MLLPGPGLLVPELALSHKTLRKLGHAEIYRVLGWVVRGQPPKNIPYCSCKGVKNRHRYFFLVENVYPKQFFVSSSTSLVILFCKNSEGKEIFAQKMCNNTKILVF